MSRKTHFAAMQTAFLTAQRQQDVMEGAIKLYGAVGATEAEKYGEIARAALDAILDAKRAHAVHMERAMRAEDDEDE